MAEDRAVVSQDLLQQCPPQKIDAADADAVVSFSFFSFFSFPFIFYFYLSLGEGWKREPAGTYETRTGKHGKLSDGDS